jgi:biopolymer transport protein TolR
MLEVLVLTRLVEPLCPKLHVQGTSAQLRCPIRHGAIMAMTTGNKAEINMTPMIDVLLVLLIIFMVIIPKKSTGLDASVPQPPSDSAQPAPPREVVVSVHADRHLDINTEPVTWDQLAERLKQILARRPDGVIYVAGAPTLDFEDVARVLDEAREAGINRVGIMPRVR